MSRRIICEACVAKRGTAMHPEDVANGLHQRLVKIIARKPADHAIEVIGESRTQLLSIICDGCGNPIPDGAPAVCVTVWRGDVCNILFWEHEYGMIVTESC